MMRPAVVSGIVTGVVLISDWPIFSLSLVTVSKVFAKVNSSQFLLVSKAAKLSRVITHWLHRCSNLKH